MSHTWSRRGIPWKPKSDDGGEPTPTPAPAIPVPAPSPTPTPATPKTPQTCRHTGQRWEPNPDNPHEIQLRRQMDLKWEREKQRRARNRAEAKQNLWKPTPKTKPKARPDSAKPAQKVDDKDEQKEMDDKEKKGEKTITMKEAEEWAKAETMIWLSEPSKSEQEQLNKDAYLRMLLLNPDVILSGNLLAKILNGV